MGAMVELLAANATVIARAFTNDRGAFTFDRIFPGTYQIKATGDSFLPTLREDLKLSSHSKVIVNLTLSTLFEAIQWLPAQPRTPDEPSDDLEMDFALLQQPSAVAFAPGWSTGGSFRR